MGLLNLACGEEVFTCMYARLDRQGIMQSLEILGYCLLLARQRVEHIQIQNIYVGSFLLYHNTTRGWRS